MVPVSLYDELEIRNIRSPVDNEKNKDGIIEVSCDHPLVPGGEKNIVYRAARLMRRIPRFRHIIILQPLTVVMATHRRPFLAARPVAAGHSLIGRKRPSVRPRARQNFIQFRLVDPIVNGIAPPSAYRD